MPPRHRTPRSGPLREDHETPSESALESLRSFRSFLMVSRFSWPVSRSAVSFALAAACFLERRCLRLSFSGWSRSVSRRDLKSEAHSLQPLAPRHPDHLREVLAVPSSFGTASLVPAWST